MDPTNTFINYLKFEKRYSPHTITSYKNDITQFGKYIYNVYGSLDWREVKHIHVRSWLVELIQGGISNRSISRKISSLQTFYKFLMRKKVVDKNPLKKIIAPKAGKRLPKYIEHEPLERLFAGNYFSKDFSGLRDQLVLKILYATGIRRSELIQLRLDQVNLEKNMLKVFGKGGKERLVPFGYELETEIRHYLDLRSNRAHCPFLIITDKGGQVYPKWVYNTVKKYLSLITTSDKKSPHVLRHSFATQLTNQGAELNAVKELLGHANLAATQIYTHNSIEKLKKVYNSAHPKNKTK